MQSGRVVVLVVHVLVSGIDYVFYVSVCGAGSQYGIQAESQQVCT